MIEVKELIKALNNTKINFFSGVPDSVLKKFSNSINNKKNHLIDGVIEKPSIKNAPSNKAVIGRYILPQKIFGKLKKQKPGKGGEIHITDAIQSLIQDNENFIAHTFSGKYLDCGTMKGYIKSSMVISKLWSYAW